MSEIRYRILQGVMASILHLLAMYIERATEDEYEKLDEYYEDRLRKLADDLGELSNEMDSNYL